MSYSTRADPHPVAVRTLFKGKRDNCTIQEIFQYLKKSCFGLHLTALNKK